MVTHLPPTFNYREAEYEHMLCNLCGANDYTVLARRDSNGLPVQTCLCRRCGLIYINPRMKKEWYAKYYQEEYRNQRARKKGKRSDYDDIDGLFRKGGRFGLALANVVADYVLSGITIEIGSSAGGVLAGFQKRIPGIIPLGVEPSPLEAEYAEAHGIPTHQILMEDLRQSLPKAANIICVRTLNHLLNPKHFFVWAYNQLLPGGKLILAVLDFRHSCKKRGGIGRAAQIDHVYMFTQETLRAFVGAAGFDIEFFDANEYKSFGDLARLKGKGLTGQHIRLVARKTDRRPFAGPLGVEHIGPVVAASMNTFLFFAYSAAYRAHRLFLRLRRRFIR